jgi:hypothetical protein
MLRNINSLALVTMSCTLLISSLQPAIASADTRGGNLLADRSEGLQGQGFVTRFSEPNKQPSQPKPKPRPCPKGSTACPAD